MIWIWGSFWQPQAYHVFPHFCIENIQSNLLNRSPVYTDYVLTKNTFCRFPFTVIKPGYSRTCLERLPYFPQNHGLSKQVVCEDRNNCIEIWFLLLKMCGLSRQVVPHGSGLSDRFHCIGPHFRDSHSDIYVGVLAWSDMVSLSTAVLCGYVYWNKQAWCIGIHIDF